MSSHTPKRRLMTGPNNEDLAAKREAFNAGPCWAKLLVSDKVAGSVIGKGGAVISDLEKLTDTIIKLSPGRTYFPGTQERLVVVAGELGPVQEAVREVSERIKAAALAETHVSTAAGDVDVTMKLAVPNSAVSCIIGRGGEVVRDINKTTGALIRASERFPGLHERIVQISGSQPEVVSAACDVVRRIQADRNLREHLNVVYTSAISDLHHDLYDSHTGVLSPVPTPPHHPVPPPALHGAAGGLMAFPCAIAFDAEDAVVAGIMGKGGVVLQRVAGQTGATVTVSGVSEKRHRTIRISGTLGAVQQAHLMVMRHIFEFSKMREPFTLLQPQPQLHQHQHAV